MTNQEKLDEFKKMVEDHDLTYMYSDDGNTYRRGSAQLDMIKLFAVDLDRADAVRIWNENVDRRLVPGARQDFYWEV